MKFRYAKGEWKLWLLFLLLLQDPLSKIPVLGSIIQYTAEVVTLFSCGYLIKRLIDKRPLQKRNSLYTSLMLMMIGVGLIVAILQGYQSLLPIVVDAFLCMKFIVVFLAMETYMSTGKRTAITPRMMRLYRGLTYVLTGLLVLNLVIPVFPVREFRYFMWAQMLFFSHPTMMVVTCVALSALFACTAGEDKRNMRCFYLSCLLAFSALRAKGVAWVAVALVLMLARNYIAAKPKASKAFIIGCGCILVVLFGYEQFAFYYLRGLRTTSRGIMISDAVYLANHHLFGTGLASFGSSMAAEYYSPLYTELGYQSVYGFTRANPTFLTDGFWNIIIGQFGWPGTVITLMYFYYLYKRCDSLKHSVYQYVASILVFVYLLISSIGETALFNTYAPMLAIVLSLTLHAGTSPHANLRKRRK